MATSSKSPPVKAGDRVRLRSGGAVMTAERVNDRAAVPYSHCSWMDARDHIHRAFIDLAALERVNHKEELASTR